MEKTKYYVMAQQNSTILAVKRGGCHIIDKIAQQVGISKRIVTPIKIIGIV